MSASTKRHCENRLTAGTSPAIGGGVAVGCYSFDSSDNVLGVYDGSGQSLPSSGIGNSYLFQGREYAWAFHEAWGGAGLYNFRARWYDPQTGRWLSNDPIGISGGLNQYAICANNPVMLVDPEGLRDAGFHEHYSDTLGTPQRSDVHPMRQAISKLRDRGSVVSIDSRPTTPVELGQAIRDSDVTILVAHGDENGSSILLAHGEEVMVEAVDMVAKGNGNYVIIIRCGMYGPGRTLPQLYGISETTRILECLSYSESSPKRVSVRTGPVSVSTQ